ncbi:MAG: EamA family transporter [Verrucomicrobia bacterium]|nr:MAG: EamA family transporter [Verrucomicrobiota bacterium]
MLAAALTTVLFSLSITFGHRASKLVGGSEANFWRLAFATAILGAWSFQFGLGLGGEAFTYFFLSGLFGFGIGDVALYQALPRLGARLAMVFTQCLAAPFGSLIEWLWLDTRLTRPQLIFIVLILAGVAVAIAPARSDPEQKERRINLLGAIFGTLAALGGAAGAVLSRKGFAVAAEAGETVSGADAAFQRIVAGLLVGGVAFLFVRWRHHNYSFDPRDLPATEVGIKKWRGLWVWVLGNALAGPVLGVSFMQWALRTTPTGIVLAIVATTPLAVIPLARIFEHEQITKRSLVGSAIAVAGVIGLAISTEPEGLIFFIHRLPRT